MTDQAPHFYFEPSPKKLLMLGVASVLVFFLTMSIPYLISFAAFPLVIAITYYERRLSLTLMGVCMMAVYIILSFMGDSVSLMLFPMYLVVVFIANLVGEVLKRKVHPSEGVKYIGVVLIALIFVGGNILLEAYRTEIVAFLTNQLVEIRDQISQDNPASAEQFQVLIGSIDSVLYLVPSGSFITVFLGIWFNLYMILKGHRGLQQRLQYPYSAKDLTFFKMPEWSVYIALAVLAVYAIPSEYIDKQYEIYARSFSYVLGTFFFLQGFGIYLDYLAHIKVGGFFRSILIAITVVFGNLIVAGIGIFDMWFDFRKHFKQKEND